MLIKSNEIARRIKENEDNLFLLYGEEDYVIDRHIQSIKKKYLDPGFIQMTPLSWISAVVELTSIH